MKLRLAAIGLSCDGDVNRMVGGRLLAVSVELDTVPIAALFGCREKRETLKAPTQHRMDRLVFY